MVLVIGYAKMLAKKLKANEEIVELGVLLHDIGGLKFGEDDHEMTGQKEAEQILKSLGASEEIISEV